MTSRAVGVALACTLVVLLSILFFVFPPSSASPSSPNAAFFILAQARVVDWGGAPAIWATLSGNAPATSTPLFVQLDALDAPPPRRVILLSGPWAGASHFDSFKSALASALRPSGWSVESSNLADLRAEGPGRFILLPSGAWPASLLAHWNDSLTPSDTLVYLGVDDNLTLDEAGLVHSGGVPTVLLSTGPELDPRLPASVVLPGPNGARVWRIAHTLDEFPDPAILAAAISARMYEPSADHVLARSTSPYSGSRWSTLQSLRSATSAIWLRLRLYDSQAKLLRLWDSVLAALDGIMDAPKTARPGQAVAVQIRLHPAYAQSEQVDYVLQVYAPDGTRMQTIPLGGGTIGASPKSPHASVWAQPPTDANDSAAANSSAALNDSNLSLSAPAWVGSSVLTLGPQPGTVRLQVVDQYGRLHAQAAIQVPDLQIHALDQSGFTRRFLLTSDGQPLSSSVVQVSRDNSTQSLALPLSNGMVEVSSDWNAGPHELHFDADGTSLSYRWTEAPGGAWAPVWQIGAPGLALAALLYLLFRPRPRPRPAYTLSVPQWPTSTPRRLEMTAAQMQSLFKGAAVRAHGAGKNPAGPVALQSSDIVSLLQHPRTGQRPVLVSPESVEQALQSLEKSARLCRWHDYYATPTDARAARPHPSASLSDGVRSLALSRRLRDALMQQGLALTPASSTGVRSDGSGHRYLVWSSQSIAQVARLSPTHLLFADHSERVAFLCSLSSDGSPAAARLSLMLKTGRLHLSLADQPLEN